MWQLNRVQLPCGMWQRDVLFATFYELCSRMWILKRPFAAFRDGVKDET
jgi:hypothetical protein